MAAAKATALGNFSRASDRIVQDLRTRIMTLELPPGATVTEEYLRDLLSCSHTPLREALQRLADERLVVAVPRKGISIAELSVIDFGHLMEALMGMETYVGGLAASRATETDLQDLEVIHRQLSQASEDRDFAKWTILDYDFHDRIAAVAGNPYLTDALSRLHRLSARFTFLGLKKAGHADGPIADHLQIIRALRSGDKRHGEQVMLDHLHHGRERMRAAL